jgi:hypothetical protein
VRALLEKVPVFTACVHQKTFSVMRLQQLDQKVEGDLSRETPWHGRAPLSTSDRSSIDYIISLMALVSSGSTLGSDNKGRHAMGPLVPYSFRKLPRAGDEEEGSFSWMSIMRITTSGLRSPWAMRNEGRVSDADSTESDKAADIGDLELLDLPPGDDAGASPPLPPRPR